MVSFPGNFGMDKYRKGLKMLTQLKTPEIFEIKLCL